jgi:hypothetical protein
VKNGQLSDLGRCCDEEVGQCDTTVMERAGFREPFEDVCRAPPDTVAHRDVAQCG